MDGWRGLRGIKTDHNPTRLPPRTPSRCYVRIQLVFGGVVSEECSFGNQRLSRPIILVFGRFFMFFFSELGADLKEELNI